MMRVGLVHILTLAHLLAASAASALTFQFDVTLDTIETTGTLATGNDAAFVPVQFATQFEVDLDALTPIGSTFHSFGPAGIVFVSATTFNVDGSAASTPTRAALLDLSPGLASNLTTAEQGELISYDSFSVFSGGTNESLFLPAARAQQTDSEQISVNVRRETSSSYSLQFTQLGLYEEAGLPADRTVDAVDILSDYLFPGATFEVRESFSTSTVDFDGQVIDLGSVTTGTRILSGTATLITVIPEPSAAMLLGLGLMALTRPARPARPNRAP